MGLQASGEESGGSDWLRQPWATVAAAAWQPTAAAAVLVQASTS